MTNYYKLEYDRQHPKKDITHVILKAIALITAIVTVAIVSRLDAYADNVILADAPYENAAQKQQIPTENEIKNSESSAKQHEYSNITISDEEYVELCQIVAAEAQTQCLEGQKAVVEVIFNRVLSPEWPDTVHGVLSQKGQFATWKMRNAKWVEPYLAVDAIASVMTNGRTVLPDTSYVYFSRGRSKYGKDWTKLQDHWFGRAR